MSADVLFDAGTELPFNDDALVRITRDGAAGAARPRVCGATQRAGASISLACPAGQIISSLPMASYGNPLLAGCQDGEFALGVCDDAGAVAAAAAACLGRTSCSVAYTGAPCSTSVSGGYTLAVVAECTEAVATDSIFARNVAGVGAYAQSGWRRINATLDAGTYTLTFAVRSVGSNDPARASALAVDNVLVCLLPLASPAGSPTPTPTLSIALASPAASVADVFIVPLLAAGHSHTCGVTPLNRLLCWGANFWIENGVFYGQATVPDDLLFANVTSVAAGFAHTCVLLGDGRVRCFGGNWEGQCNVPAQLADGRVPVAAVSAGGYFSCALTRTGEVLCWGYSPWATTPAIMSRGAIAIASGSRFSCGITAYRTVACWGDIAQPPASLASTPVFSIATSMAWGVGNSACAATATRVVCWGGWSVDTSLEVSVASIAIQNHDVALLLSSGSVLLDFSIVGLRRVALVCGAGHCCHQSALDGTLTCFGGNAYGQASPPLLQPFATPLPRALPSDLNAPVLPCDAALGGSSVSPAVNCAEYAARACNTTEGVRWIRPEGVTAAYQAVCHDGFALAMRLSGSGAEFQYGSGFWTNDTLFNSNPAVFTADAKLEPFTSYPLTHVRLRNRAAGTLHTIRVLSARSLAAMYSDLGDTLVELRSGARAGWLSLAPGLCAQENCNVQALNLYHPFFGRSRLGIMFNEQNDCGSPDTSFRIGSSINVAASCATPPDLEIYVGTLLPFSPPSSITSTSLTASPSLGASPSLTASLDGSRTPTASPTGTPPATPSRSGSPRPSGSPTGTLTLRASASTTASGSATPPPSATPSVSPYCGVGEYRYFPGRDVDGDPAGGAAAGSERECARACCDVPGCDAYAWTSGAHPVNCFFVGNVTGIVRNSLLSAGVRTRIL